MSSTKSMKLLFSVLLTAACGTIFALSYKENPAGAEVEAAGHRFTVNKKTVPAWGSCWSLTVDRDKNLRLSMNAGVEDEIYPKGTGQLVPSRTPAKISIQERTAHTLTVRAEYNLAPVGKKNTAEYAGLKMIYYYSFTDGLPGTAVTARLLAVDRNAVIRSFNGSFGAGFSHYTTETGERIEYPGKSWNSIKGNSVTAERADGTKMFLTAKTRNPGRGFTWIGRANQWHKVTLHPGEFIEVRGMIGFVNDNRDIDALKNFFQSIRIPAEKKNTASVPGKNMTASPVKAGKDGFPIQWPADIVVRKGTGWIRPDNTDTWKGDDNLSFTATAGFDDKYLYIRADVTDSVFRQQNSGGRIWAGDCIQVAFDPLNEKSMSGNYILLGFTATDQPTAWCWDHPNRKYRSNDISEYCRVRGTRTQTGQVYEVAIPWKLLEPFSLDRGQMGFNIVVLDDDGFSVKQWMGITDGIAGGKNPALYQGLFFADPEKVMLSSTKNPAPLLRLDSDIAVGEVPLKFAVAEILPDQLAGAELTVTAGKKIFTEKLKPGFNSFQYTLKSQELKPGMLKISAVVRKNGETVYTIGDSVRIVTRGAVEKLCVEALAEVQKMQNAVAMLKKKDKNTAYFTNRIALTEYFVRMVRLDNTRESIFRQPTVKSKYQQVPVTPEYRRFIYRRSIKNLDYCIRMLKDGIAEAEKIAAGKLPDRIVEPMPRRGQVTIANGGLQLNGKEMFFLGPNTWQFHYTQLKDIAGAGMNFFDINVGRARLPKDMKPFEEKYDPNNMSLKFNPIAMDVAGDLGMYFLARQFSSSGYVQELNKPGSFAKDEAVNREAWLFQAKQPHLAYLISHPESFVLDRNTARLEKNVRNHLRKTFGTVAKMNAALGTNYKSFDDFKDSDRTRYPSLKYEVFRFEREQNFKVLRAGNQAKRAFWKRPTTTHISTSHWTAWDTLQDCADYEALYEECDIAGYDAGVRLESQRYAASWEAVFMLCDFSRSLFPDKPVANNETHNFPINCASDVSGEFIYTAQISEMLHGRNAAVMWCWEKNYHSPWGSYAFTRANCFHAASKAALDARRLAPEIAAFRSEKRQFAIFYSLPSFCDTGNYKRVNDLYQGTFFHGIAPGFITEKRLLQNWFPDCRLILIPDARRVSDAVFEALMKRVETGVKVVRFGEKSLMYDEYGKLKKERAKRLASLPLYPVSEPEQYFPLIGKLFRELGIRGKYEVTATDGKKLPALEYRSTPDGKLFYVINWNKAAQKVKLPAGRWRELISETDSPQTFELKPLEVRLFRRQ